MERMTEQFVAFKSMSASNFRSFIAFQAMGLSARVVFLDGLSTLRIMKLRVADLPVTHLNGTRMYIYLHLDGWFLILNGNKYHQIVRVFLCFVALWERQVMPENHEPESSAQRVVPYIW